MTDAELPEVLTLREIAERERVSADAVLRWAATGELPAYRFGRQWRVKREDYLAFRKPLVSAPAERSKRERGTHQQRQEAADNYLDSIGL